MWVIIGYFINQEVGYTENTLLQLKTNKLQHSFIELSQNTKLEYHDNSVFSISFLLIIRGYWTENRGETLAEISTG